MNQTQVISGIEKGATYGKSAKFASRFAHSTFGKIAANASVICIVCWFMKH